ncbi:hypothetical protein P8881_19695 [Bacillus haynesii]|nr:hypothetical protein [Bacillus haynesii]MEC0736870.1 hypothetical protein [Bacillus haynesii]
MLIGSKNKKELLDNELTNYLDRTIRDRAEINVGNASSINVGLLYSTLTILIYLLSRKRRNNSLHMHMIMYLSDEINSFIDYTTSGKSDEHKLKNLARKAELLLRACKNAMDLAETKTRKFKQIEHVYIFKDEKNIISSYLDITQ